MAEKKMVANLDVERARNFLRQLAEDPFICVVVAEDGNLKIFSKGLEESHLGRIRDAIREINRQRGEVSG